jgi:hypothetical protein
MRVGEGQRKGEKLEKPENGFGWRHRNVKKKFYVAAIVHVGCLYLEKVGGMVNHQLVLKRLGLASSGVENVSQLFAIQ